MALTLKSPQFEDNEFIPQKYTCDGEDINPPLKIEGVPEGTKSLALIVDDPDAPMGTWDHWVVYNISPDIIEIQEGEVPQDAIQGINDFGETNYGGPCPPAGAPHRYVFKLYALDGLLQLPSGATKEDLEKTMEGHVLEETKLIGKYQR